MITITVLATTLSDRALYIHVVIQNHRNVQRAFRFMKCVVAIVDLATSSIQPPVGNVTQPIIATLRDVGN